MSVDDSQDHVCIEGRQKPLFFLVKKGEVREKYERRLKVSISSFNFVDKVPL